MENIRQNIKKVLGEAVIGAVDFTYNELIPKLAPQFGVVIKIDEQGSTSNVYLFTGWQYSQRAKPLPGHEIITVPTDQLHQQQVQPTDLVEINYERNGLTLYSRFGDIVENSLELGKDWRKRNRENI